MGKICNLVKFLIEIEMHPDANQPIFGSGTDYKAIQLDQRNRVLSGILDSMRLYSMRFEFYIGTNKHLDQPLSA